MPTQLVAETPALPRIYAWFSGLMAGDTESLDALLAHGMPIDTTHPLRHSTALMEATRQGKNELVAWLLAQGASAAQLSGLPLGTPLHCALRRRHWQIAAQLIPAMAHAGTVDAYGRTALHLLAMESHSPADTQHVLALAQALIASECPLDARDTDGITTLHHAVVNDNLELAELLLKKGTSVDVAVAETGVTPLVIAALEKNNAMCELLMEHGANPYHKTHEGTRPASIYPPLLRIIMRAKAG